MPESISLLEQPVYRMDQVDRLLGTPNGAARNWIDGCRRGRSSYGPLIRAARTGSDTVTWGEFVAARLIAEYRDRGVEVFRLRLAIVALREAFSARPIRSRSLVPSGTPKATPAAVDDAIRFLSVA